MAGKVALITGANGITGCGLIEYFSNKTTREEWSNIIATSLSPLQSTVQDSRLSFIPLDFTKSPEDLIPAMKPICANVTHAYFSSYVHSDDFEQLNKSNKMLFENFLDALVEVAPKLECCVLQTGAKYYNLHLEPVPSPAREENPRLPSPIGNFYFPQEDYLMEKQKGQSWRWNVIRPEAIIGHTIKPNGMNEALTLAVYFLTCKQLNVEAKMPTNQIYFEGYEDKSDVRLIADLSIWASTHPHAGNQAFNATNGDHFSWKWMWPRLANYFGVKASSEQVFQKTRPEYGQTQLDSSLLDWGLDEEKLKAWESLCEDAGCPGAKKTWAAATWAFQDFVFRRGWSGTLSINKARKFGWTGHVDSFESYRDTFESFIALGQIPPLNNKSGVQ